MQTYLNLTIFSIHPYVKHLSLPSIYTEKLYTTYIKYFYIFILERLIFKPKKI
jgi:hypothetical protein